MSTPQQQPKPKTSDGGGCLEALVVIGVILGFLAMIAGAVYFCVWFIATAWSSGAS